MDLGTELIGRRFGEGGRLELMRVLGEGASGVVFLAKDHRRERPVALKFLHPDRFFDRRLIKRFRNEGQRFVRLQHPNLVRIYGFGREQGLLYIASEFVLGDTLLGLLRRGDPLGIPRCLEVARSIAAGLRYAHGEGVVHRDLKPENVMVRRNDGRVKVLDFGIAKDVEATTDITRGEFVGTPGYSAPEQHAGEVEDGRSDVFSLGVLLFEIASGRPLGHSQADAPRPATAELDVRPLAETGELYERFASLIRGMTRKNPSDRLPSMELVDESLSQLESWVGSLDPVRLAAADGQLRDRLQTSSWPLPGRRTS